MPDKWRLFFYGKVLVWSALLAAFGACIADYQQPWLWLLLPVGLAIVLAVFVRSIKISIFIVLVPLLFFAYAYSRSPTAVGQKLQKYEGKMVALQAVVEGVLEGKKNTDKKSTDKKSIELNLAAKELTYPERCAVGGKLIITVSGGCTLASGDLIEVRVLLAKSPEKNYNWEFDKTGYLRRYGACLSGFVRSSDAIKVIGHVSAKNWLSCIFDNADAARQKLIAIHKKNLGLEQGAFLTSMVIGDRAVDLPSDRAEQFRDVGLSHVLAASGFNLTIVSGCTWFLVRLVTKSILLTNFACFLSMLVFVVMAGPSPSVLRAALMLCCLLITRSLSRQSDLSVALACALIVALIVDPLCLADVGFQLSYIATAAIIAGVEPIGGCLISFLKDNIVWKRFIEVVVVIVVAQASVFPIQLFYFWYLGLFFLPANLIVAPLVHVTTLLGFASSLLAVIDLPLASFVVTLLDQIIHYPLSAIMWTVSFLASFKQAKLVLGPPSLWLLAGYYVVFSAFIASLRLGRFRFVSSVLLILALVGLFVRPAAPKFTIAFLKNTVVLMDSNRRAYSLAADIDKELSRFLLYHGATLMPKPDSVLLKQADGCDLIGIRPVRVLLVVIDGKSLSKVGQHAGVVGAIKSERGYETLVLHIKGRGNIKRRKQLQALMTELAWQPSCVKITSRDKGSLVLVTEVDGKVRVEQR